MLAAEIRAFDDMVERPTARETAEKCLDAESD